MGGRVGRPASKRGQSQTDEPGGAIKLAPSLSLFLSLSEKDRAKNLAKLEAKKGGNSTIKQARAESDDDGRSTLGQFQLSTVPCWRASPSEPINSSSRPCSASSQGPSRRQ